MGQIMNAALSRRTDWTGAAFLVQPHGYPMGYYRMTHIDPQSGWWMYSYLGDEMPKGEPVYVWEPDTWDFKAIPATVRPAGVFALAALVEALWTLMAFTFFAPTGVGGGEVFFWALMSLVILGWPFYVWFYNIEPVRGSKVSAAIVAATAAHAAAKKAEAERMRSQGLL